MNYTNYITDTAINFSQNKETYINYSSGYFSILLAMYCRTTFNDATA
jgi:hypothetical protein